MAVKQTSRLSDCIVIGILLVLLVGFLIAFFEQLGMSVYVARTQLIFAFGMLSGIVMIGAMIIFIEKHFKEKESTKA